MPDATVGERSDAFVHPDLSIFSRHDELGLVVTGQRVEACRAVLACRVQEPDQWCHRCACQGTPRDTATRQLAHEPLGWRPTTLMVTIRRNRCTGCGHVVAPRSVKARSAPPAARLTRRLAQPQLRD